MPDKTIQITFLEEYSSLGEAIQKLCGLSLGQIKKFITKPSKLKSKIKKGQTIEIPIDVVNYNKVFPEYIGPEVKVLFDDENFLVLNKPENIHIHPLCYSEADNLVSFVAQNFPKYLNVNKDNYDRGFIYRLDYGTSGIVYYAKTDDVYQELRQNFKNIVKEKIYFAVIEGLIQEKRILKNSLGQVKGNKKVSVGFASEGDEEVTIEVDLVEANVDKRISIVKVKLNEGKRHQIRAQLAFAGFPILGDEQYGGKPAERICLHCFSYQFQFHGKIYDLSCELPELFRNFTNFD